jgi:hypothetical protein
MSDVDTRATTACALEWAWDADSKTWLVKAVSMRDGGRRVVAQCHVLRRDPLPDHQLANLLHAVIDYWQAGFLF